MPHVLNRLAVRCIELSNYLRSALTRDEGQGLVEYMMIVIGIAIFLIIVVAVIGHVTSNTYNNIQRDIHNAATQA